MNETPSNPHKLLIAVKSCVSAGFNGVNTAILETWGKGIADLRFFVGRAAQCYELRMCEIRLNCGDAYIDLPEKAEHILRWSLRHEFEFTALVDTDTFIIPERLMACGFEDFDVTSNIGGNTENGKYFPWPNGGAGYILSRKAAQLVVDAPWPAGEWAEDRGVGQILGPHIRDRRLVALNHPGFHRIYPDDPLRCDVTMHFDGKGKKQLYDPSWMKLMWNYNRVKV